MSRPFSLASVIALLLALLSPASPASNATGDLPDFTAQAVDLQIAIVNGDTGEYLPGWMGFINYNGQDQHLGDEAFEPVARTFSGIRDGEHEVYAYPYTDDPFDGGEGFQITISGGVVTAFHLYDQPNATVELVNGVYELPIYTANFNLEVLDPDGQLIPTGQEVGPRLNAEIQLQVGASWSQVGWATSYEIYDESDVLQESGVKGRITDPGTYRLRIFPEGLDNAAVTVSNTFTVTGSETERITFAEPVTLTSPTLVINVVMPGSTEPLDRASARTYVNDEGIDYNSGDQAFPMGLVYEAEGTYELDVWKEGLEGYSSKRYTVTVTRQGNKLVGSISGVTPVDGVYNLEIGSANLIIRAIDPRDNSGLQESNVNVIMNVNGERQDWVDGTWSQDGNTMSLTIDDGNYFIELMPQNAGYQLSTILYNLTVSNSGDTIVITTTDGSQTEISPDGEGIFQLPVALSNIVGRLADESGNIIRTSWEMRQWVSVELLKYNVDGDYWSYASYTNADSDGYFSLRVTESGTYRADFRPQGFADAANKSIEFTISESDISGVKDLGEGSPQYVVLPQPDAKLVVRAPGGDANLRQAHIEVLQSGAYVSSTNTGDTGIAAVTFPAAGEYELRVNPPRSAPGTARASYTATVTNNGSDMAVTISGASESAGNWILELGVPTLSGVVYDPSGENVIRDTDVVPVDAETGWQVWEYSARTDSYGRWSMALPEGTYYIYPRARWGDSTYGDGERLGPVVVSSSGAATSIPRPGSADAFDLRLSYPTWSGLLVSPYDSEQILTNGEVCLSTGQYENQTWTCSQANFNGEWAISKPAGFSGFDETTELQVRQWGSSEFAERRARGASEVAALLGDYVDGETYTDIVLSPAAPNLEVRVFAGLDGDGNPAPARRVWVGVESEFEWLGGGQANGNGVARLSVPDSALGGFLRVQVNVEHTELNGQFAPGRVEFSADSGFGDVRTLEVSLVAPNFYVKAYEPDGVTAAGGSWIEAFNETTDQWEMGSNADQTGFATLSLSASSTYRVTVNPAWNSSVPYGRGIYEVVVDGSGNIASVNNSATQDGEGNWELALLEPSVRGVVLGSDGNPVRDSWVTPIAANGWEYLWWLGANSRAGGAFAISLPADGVYELEANPSWNNTLGDTKSERCEVNISGGLLDVGYQGCRVVAGKVELELRAPNVVFTLTDGTDPVQFANVGMFLNGWSVWANSDRNGRVALNLDGAEIAARTGLSTGTHNIRIVVEPPFGNSDLARWDCDSGDSRDVCFDIPDFDASDPNGYMPTNLDLGEIAFPEPNTKLRVASPDGQPLESRGSWVTIFRETPSDGCPDCRQWLAGANTDSTGWASFNLDDTSGSFTVEVNPPQNLRGTYAPSIYSGLTHSELLTNSPFALAMPNFRLKVSESDGSTAARWAWIGVEEVSGGNYYWIAGTSADRLGKAALNLPANKAFKVTLNPQPGSNGSRTSCLFETDGNGAVSLTTGSCANFVTSSDGVWQIRLKAGNVIGKAFYQEGTDQIGIAGVLIQATAVGEDKQTTVTKADGTYSFDLKPGTDWTIKAFYVPADGVPLFTGNVIGLSTFRTNDDEAVQISGQDIEFTQVP